MDRFEVTFTACGPWKDGTRLEARVTFPVALAPRPELTPENRRQLAIVAARPDWDALVPALEVAAGGAQLRVSVSAEQL